MFCTEIQLERKIHCAPRFPLYKVQGSKNISSALVNEINETVATVLYSVVFYGRGMFAKRWLFPEVEYRLRIFDTSSLLFSKCGLETAGISKTLSGGSWGHNHAYTKDLFKMQE